VTGRIEGQLPESLHVVGIGIDGKEEKYDLPVRQQFFFISAVCLTAALADQENRYPYPAAVHTTTVGDFDCIFVAP
jgi:hypothetical protein